MENWMLRRERPGERAALAEFAAKAFETNGERVDFPALLPKLYGAAADPAPVHTVLEEAGEIGAIFALEQGEFSVGGKPLSVGWLGTVAVRADCRGRGLLKVLLDEARRQMMESGCDLAILGGLRSRYRPYGYEMAGSQWRFSVTSRELRGLASEEKTVLRPLEAADAQAAAALRRGLPVFGQADPDRLMALLSSWGCRAFGVWQEGKLTGYAAVTESGSVYELCLTRPGALVSVLEQLLRDYPQGLEIDMGAWPGPCQRRLAELCASARLMENHSYQIFHYAPVAAAAAALRVQTFGPLAPGEGRIPIQGEGVLTLRSDGRQVETVWEENGETLGLSAAQATRLLLGHDSSLVEGATVPAGWLPLPMAFSWMDGI